MAEAETPAWVFAVERAYVAIATRGAPAVAEQLPELSPDQLVAASFAVASRFLAVAAPRSLALVIDTPARVAAARLALEAHRAWFDPRDIRCACATADAGELATAAGGRACAIDEALGADIVCVFGAVVPIAAAKLRRGTHVNLELASTADDELRALATAIDTRSLPAMAAGFVEGRRLDELTVFGYAAR